MQTTAVMGTSMYLFGIGVLMTARYAALDDVESEVVEHASIHPSIDDLDIQLSAQGQYNCTQKPDKKDGKDIACQHIERFKIDSVCFLTVRKQRIDMNGVESLDEPWIWHEMSPEKRRQISLLCYALTVHPSKRNTWVYTCLIRSASKTPLFTSIYQQTI